MIAISRSSVSALASKVPQPGNPALCPRATWLSTASPAVFRAAPGAPSQGDRWPRDRSWASTRRLLVAHLLYIFPRFPGQNVQQFRIAGVPGLSTEGCDSTLGLDGTPAAWRASQWKAPDQRWEEGRSHDNRVRALGPHRGGVVNPEFAVKDERVDPVRNLHCRFRRRTATKSRVVPWSPVIPVILGVTGSGRDMSGLPMEGGAIDLGLRRCCRAF